LQSLHYDVTVQTSLQSGSGRFQQLGLDPEGLRLNLDNRSPRTIRKVHCRRCSDKTFAAYHAGFNARAACHNRQRSQSAIQEAIARGRYAPDSYHDFIGFGLGLKSVLSDEDKVLGSYRHDVGQLLPKATRIAWSLKKDEIMNDQPGMTKKKFLYNLSRASYQKSWGENHQPPTFLKDFSPFL
jgi:hypothetical protein